MRTRELENGEIKCLISESGDMTLWGECPAAPLQMSVGNPSMNAEAVAGGLLVIACGCLLFLWAGSLADARRRRYQRLFTSVKRGLQ